MTYHKPKDLDPITLRYLQECDIRPAEGSVHYKGQEVGFVQQPQGYVILNIYLAPRKFKRIKRSHAIWWKAYGEWPTNIIDHKDRDRANDEITNLVLSDALQNAQNRELRS